MMHPMQSFSMELFLASLALVGVVIVISALLSGLIDKIGFPQAAVFLLLGVLIGPSGMGLVQVGVESPVLRVVSTLSLTLVLFTDAVSVDLASIRKNSLLTFLVVGPGTLLTAVLVSLAAWKLLGVSWPAAAILGAALASTDPVILRGLLRRPGLSQSVRQTLHLESGLNDIVLLPIVLVATALLQPGAEKGGINWGHMAIALLLLGPTAGIATGLIGVAALDLIRRKVGVRRDYESLYSLGLALIAFAAAEAVHGSGFLAAFAAGLTISALDVELCDCFLEYGETTAEMALLFTFVLFGTSVIWTGLQAIGPATLLFTAAVLLARPAGFLPALAFTKLTWPDRALISWFGPRGLSSLLLVMLAVFAGADGARQLLTVCCLVVLVSVVLHGFSPMVLLRKRQPQKESGEPPSAASPEPEAVISRGQAEEVTAAPSPAQALPPVLPSESEYITIDELNRLRQEGSPTVVIDARTDRTYNESDMTAEGAIRLNPEHSVAAEAERLKVPRGALLAIFCA